jgi:hypothetical protein
MIILDPDYICALQRRGAPNALEKGIHSSQILTLFLRGATALLLGLEER